MPRYPSPDEDCMERGKKVFFAIDRDSPRHNVGEIWDYDGHLLWSYRRSNKSAAHSIGNPLGKRDFVISDASGTELCVIRRKSFFPSRFVVLESGETTGLISLRGFLKNRYAIDIQGAKTWTFRLTLFSLFFWGDANGEPALWVRVGPTKMEWNALLKPGMEPTPLLFALAFIHNEWWNYS